MRPNGFVLLPGDIRKGVDPNDIPLADLSQLIQLENEFERLVPGNIEQLQAHLGFGALSDDHVEPAHIRD